MKTLALMFALTIALSASAEAKPLACPVVIDAAGAQWVCCTQSNGQQCCSQSSDGSGNPSGCSCG